MIEADLLRRLSANRPDVVGVLEVGDVTSRAASSSRHQARSNDDAVHAMKNIPNAIENCVTSPATPASGDAIAPTANCSTPSSAETEPASRP